MPFFPNEGEVKFISKKATTIAIVNQKGGTGKTTTCENLGIGLAMEGKKVLLGWQNILYRRICVDFYFLAVHKVCTKVILLGAHADGR